MEMFAIARLCRLLGCALDPQPLVQPPISDRAIVRGGRHRQQPREEQPRRAEGEEQVRWTSLPGRLLRRFGRDHDDLPSPHIAGRRARLPLMQPVCQPIRASRARACRRSTRLARLSRKAPASLVSRQPPRRFPSLTTAQVAPAPPARHRGLGQTAREARVEGVGSGCSALWFEGSGVGADRTRICYVPNPHAGPAARPGAQRAVL